MAINSATYSAQNPFRTRVAETCSPETLAATTRAGTLLGVGSWGVAGGLIGWAIAGASGPIGWGAALVSIVVGAGVGGTAGGALGSNSASSLGQKRCGEASQQADIWEDGRKAQ